MKKQNKEIQRGKKGIMVKPGKKHGWRTRQERGAWRQEAREDERKKAKQEKARK